MILGDAVDPRNVRMIEGREDVRLALEAGTPVGVARDRVRQDLESHVPLQLRVASAMDLAHPPAPSGARSSYGPNGAPGWSGIRVARL
jgi:hypothetical protein